MTKHIAATVVLFAIVCSLVIPFGLSGADKRSDQTKSITVDELNQMKVIGKLGHPLGTIVTIEGVVGDQTYEKKKMDWGKVLLRVQKVDGKKLPVETIFYFDESLKLIDKPKVNANFKYVGYETGGYGGVPAKLFDYVGTMTTTGYGFTTHIEFIRDELAKK